MTHCDVYIMMCFNGFPIASLNATKSDIVAKRLLLCISSTLIALFVASMLQYEWYVFSVVHIIILRPATHWLLESHLCSSNRPYM